MEQFDLYIHGVPVGHEICGCNDELDYIKRFYNHDVKVEVSSLLQIDIVNGKSFYTYLRKKNVRNVEGRPGSYLGLTVSFSDRYCTNVKVLYELLDAIYKQICVDSLVRSEQSADRFLVKEISACRYKGHPVVDCVKAVFNNNMENLHFDVLKGFVNSKLETKFSLAEVDSPLFHDTLKNKRILVSSEYEMASVAYNNLLEDVEPIRNENDQLKRANIQLTESNNNLSTEVARLEKELADSTKSADKKSKVQLEKLQAQLNECEQERKKLDNKIKEATNAVDLIDEPFKKLTRLLADRFQKEGEKSNKKNIEIPLANRTKHTKEQWISMGSIVLLFAVVCLCGYCCYAVSKLHEAVAVVQQTGQKVEEQALNDSIEKIQSEQQGNNIAGPVYDDYKNCRIDISDAEKLTLGSSHTLSLMTIDRKALANVPKGEWESTPGITIKGNIFKVDTVSENSFNVQIYYTVNKEHVITRTINLKK